MPVLLNLCTLCLFFFPIFIFAQDYISNLSFEQKENNIQVDYHLNKITSTQYYKVQIVVESEVVGKLAAYEFTGAIGKVYSGGTKSIVWNVQKDISRLKGEIEIYLTATLYEKTELYETEDLYKEAKKYYENENYKEARILFEILADKRGHALSQNYLGYMYFCGNGVDKSLEEAVKWYRKSAEQNNSKGQTNLGAMYQNGYGVDQSIKEAVKWYRKSAKQGANDAKEKLKKLDY